eukprot:446022-Amphidinium_carterae.2
MEHSSRKTDRLELTQNICTSSLLKERIYSWHAEACTLLACTLALSCGIRGISLDCFAAFTRGIQGGASAFGAVDDVARMAECL